MGPLVQSGVSEKMSLGADRYRDRCAAVGQADRAGKSSPGREQHV